MEFKRRLTALQGLTAAPGNLDQQLAFFTKAIEAGEAEEELRKASERQLAELLEQARNKVPDAMQQLQALRTERIDLLVRATSSFASMMYETQTLADDEQACIEHTYKNLVNVRYVGQDGGARTVKAVQAFKRQYIDMRELTSDEVGYQIRDINTGNTIPQQAQATVDIGMDLANKVDFEAYALLVGGTINGKNYGDGVFGNFKWTGPKLSRTAILHPRINASNLPAKNDYTNDDLDPFEEAGQTGDQLQQFRLAVIRLAIAHCAKFGNIFDGRPIRPTGAIFIPSSEATALASEIKPTGSTSNTVADGIMADFLQFDYLNIRWTLIPDVTLPKGRCYFVLNRPVGRILTKPQMDTEWVETNKRKNWETRGMTKVVAFYTLENWKPFALRIAYNDSPQAQPDTE